MVFLVRFLPWVDSEPNIWCTWALYRPLGHPKTIFENSDYKNFKKMQNKKIQKSKFQKFSVFTNDRKSARKSILIDFSTHW